MKKFRYFLPSFLALSLLVSGLSLRSVSAEVNEPNDDKEIQQPTLMSQTSSPNLFPKGLIWVSQSNIPPNAVLAQLEMALASLLPDGSYSIHTRFTKGIIGFSVLLDTNSNNIVSQPAFKDHLQGFAIQGISQIKFERDTPSSAMSLSANSTFAGTYPDAHQLFTTLNPSQQGTTNTGSGVIIYPVDTGIGKHIEFKAGQVKKGFSIDGGGENDCNGHGTGVAGAIGGVFDGAANDADIIPVKVFAGCDRFTTASAVISGVNFIMNDMASRGEGKYVVNMSLAGNYSQALNDAVFNLSKSGAVVVVAAGNGGSTANSCDISPASANGVIAVGGLDANGNIAPYTSGGGCIDVYAPGQHYVPHYDIENTPSSLMQIKAGTSIATAVTSGQIARYLETTSAGASIASNTLITNIFSPRFIRTRSSSVSAVRNLIIHMIASNSGSEIGRDSCYIAPTLPIKNLAPLTQKAIQSLSNNSPTQKEAIATLQDTIEKALVSLDKLGRDHTIETNAIVNPIGDEVNFYKKLAEQLERMKEDLSRSNILAQKRNDHKATLLHILQRLQDEPYTLTQPDDDVFALLQKMTANVKANNAKSPIMAEQIQLLLELLPQIEERYANYAEQLNQQNEKQQDFRETIDRMREISEKLRLISTASPHELFELLKILNEQIQMLQRYQFKRSACIRDVGIRGNDIVMMIHETNVQTTPSRIMVKDTAGKTILTTTTTNRPISYLGLPLVSSLTRSSFLYDYDKYYRTNHWTRNPSLPNGGWCTLTGPQQFCLADTGKHQDAPRPPTTYLMNVPVTGELVVPMPKQYPTFDSLPEGKYTIEVTIGGKKIKTYFTKLIGVGSEGVGDRGCF